jgi:CMP/dCMP kinase
MKGGLTLINIAIDGPAGAGKNTGAMYRTVALKALENNIEINEIDKLCTLIDSLEMHFEGDNLIVNGKIINKEISTPEISKCASKYAAVPEIRKKLVKLQRDMAKKYNVVMDGRDIGTVVLKNTPYKFFLNAAAEERAKRRYTELIQKKIEVQFDSILKEITKRDYYDSHREIDPLRKAEDAIEIDSTNITINEVIAIMEEYIINNSKN